jgi:hypothetical protein
MEEVGCPYHSKSQGSGRGDGTYNLSMHIRMPPGKRGMTASSRHDVAMSRNRTRGWSLEALVRVEDRRCDATSKASLSQSCSWVNTTFYHWAKVHHGAESSKDPIKSDEDERVCGAGSSKDPIQFDEDDLLSNI